MKQYKIETTEEKLKEGVNLLRQAGGSVNTESGFFQISGVRGQIAFKDNICTIQINDKPWLASWEMIEEKISDFFE